MSLEKSLYSPGLNPYSVAPSVWGVTNPAFPSCPERVGWR